MSDQPPETILTMTEAATALRSAEDDPNMLDLLPLVDAYLKQATGRDWTADDPIYDEAKSAARMLLVMWHENPGMINMPGSSLGFGLAAVLFQLKMLALRYKVFQGSDGAGAIILTGAHLGDSVSNVVGKVGVSGDQAASFETVITIEGQIQQISTDDLSDNWYQAQLKSPGEL